MTIRINHVALWCADLEAQRCFYQRYFAAVASDRYHNPAKGFTSYFLSLGDGARLELMARADIPPRLEPQQQTLGLTHLALSLGSQPAVDALCAQMQADGLAILDGPRWTGDGYYEFVVLDPEGNRLEVTV